METGYSPNAGTVTFQYTVYMYPSCVNIATVLGTIRCNPGVFVLAGTGVEPVPDKGYTIIPEASRTISVTTAFVIGLPSRRNDIANFVVAPTIGLETVVVASMAGPTTA
jgi:hypothetical protein